MIKYVSIYNVSIIYEACFLGKYRFDIKKTTRLLFNNFDFTWKPGT